jgi:hypothetical protein
MPDSSGLPALTIQHSAHRIQCGSSAISNRACHCLHCLSACLQCCCLTRSSKPSFAFILTGLQKLPPNGNVPLGDFLASLTGSRLEFQITPARSCRRSARAISYTLLYIRSGEEGGVAAAAAAAAFFFSFLLSSFFMRKYEEKIHQDISVDWFRFAMIADRVHLRKLLSVLSFHRFFSPSARPT